MTTIRFAQIQTLVPHMAEEYRDAFKASNVNKILTKYEISKNPLRICHFLAQVFAETGGLSVLRESLNYSPTRLMEVWPRRFPTLDIAAEYAHDERKLGDFVYGGRLGNSNPGDGYLFRGRGLLQITGRGAYARFGQQLGIALTEEPDLAFAPAHSLEIAAAEWAASGYGGRRCNELADNDDIRGVTFAVNGGQTGINDRILWLKRCKQIWLSADAVTVSISSRAAANTGSLPEVAPAVPHVDADVASAPLAEVIAPTGAPFDPVAAVACGQFVKAAYSMYKAAPDNLTPSPSADFPQGYRLAAWVQMRDFILGSLTPVFYGFIAQSTTDPKRFTLAIRGTSNGVEWWDDANAVVKTPFKVPGCGSVGAGFARIYDTLEVVEPTAPALAAPARSLGLAGGFSRQVSALLHRHAPAAVAAAAPLGPGASLTVTGHSLGAALATLYAMENAHTDRTANELLCTFASPLVGDAAFAAVFNALSLTSWRIVNAPDVVPKLPPEIFGFRHVNAEQLYNSIGKVTPSFGCWHALSTYLSLIDTTLQPDADCLLAPAVIRPAPAGVGAQPRIVGRNQVNKPFVIDLYQGDNVQDTPGPLGGFARTKASGIAFLIHKASEGVSGVDRRYRARRLAWMDGIPVTVTDVTGEVLQLAPRFAAYHFFHGQDPEAEARHFLATAQLQPGDDAAVDWEQVGASGFQPSADAVDAFCNIVEAELGFPIIVYSGNVAKEQLRGRDPRFAKRRLWLASYGRTFTVQESWDYPWLWQDDGDDSGPGPHTIPGIDGFCDNSTIAAPMTIKRLHDEWGGGSHVAQAQPGLAAAPAVIAQAQPGLAAPTVVAPVSRILQSEQADGFTGTVRKIARYGWKPDLPDQRDFSYAVPAGIIKTLARGVDLRPQCPPVYDQGHIGSCTANAIAAALQFDMMKQGLDAFLPSRLFIYYNERTMEGHVGSDSGAYIRDGIKSVATQGDCPEGEWTYDGTAALPDGTFPPGAKAARRPSRRCYTDAVRHKALNYQSVTQNLADMRGCLSSGYPFVFGFTVFESFESDAVARSGQVPMPGAAEKVVGGHAVLAVGYDDDDSVFICRNSWGPAWGKAGYFFMPYAYLLDTNLSADFWTIRLTE